MRLFSRARHTLLSAAMACAAGPACYSAGGGTAPPPDTFYFPVALVVSSDGTVLYAANSDFDLQYNGGTLQSYDLVTIRQHVAELIEANLSGAQQAPGDVPFIDGSQWMPNCAISAPPAGMPLGQSCSPPVKSTVYQQYSVVIGAFASGMQLSNGPLDDGRRSRLYVTVRGDVTMTWADVDPSNPDSEQSVPAAGARRVRPKFFIDCGEDSQHRCDAFHRAGDDANQPGNTRNAIMPGEPFGMAQTEDGTAVVITHQSDTKSSLLKTGLSPISLTSSTMVGGVGGGVDGGAAVPAISNPPPSTPAPTMEFVLDGLPSGGVGIAAVPHDPDAPVRPCEDTEPDIDMPPCARPAFLQTSRSNAEIDLIRYYDDKGSSLNRPFIQREAAYPLVSNAVGTDSRGIVIDRTPRLACKAQPGADPQACATTYPARVFFASRTPPALGLGTIGGTPSVGPSGPAMYDPDLFTLTGNVPLPNGPSNVYLAPIVDQNGNYALRVFIVCFDSNQVVVYDPDVGAVENIINVGPGPFGMAFDPFSMEDVAAHAHVQPATGLGPYRFAYVASFTESYVQVIDLQMLQTFQMSGGGQQSQPTAETFERVVYTLGQPTLPKGQ